MVQKITDKINKIQVKYNFKASDPYMLVDNNYDSRNKYQLLKSKSQNVKLCLQNMKSQYLGGLIIIERLLLQEMEGPLDQNKTKNNGVINSKTIERLRKLGENNNKEASIATKEEVMRTTRSMAQPQLISNTPKARKRTRDKKRNIKSIQKSTNDQSVSDHESDKEMKRNSTRDDYFHRYGSIYQEYDDYLNKRRKNKKIQFINNYSETNEELLGSSIGKDGKKSQSNINGTQDTFCY